MKVTAHRTMIALSAVFIAVLIAGCEKIQPGEPFSCRIGTNYLLDHAVVFSIDSISDYRCPKDLICIWGGDVDLYFDIKINLVRTDTMIQLYRNNPIDAGNYTWQILDVDPLPGAYQRTDPEDYRIKILIQKK
jgi:hypothetical protein